MVGVAEQMDEWGRPAWIVAMVAAFILFWPAGLALLAFMIWSGRMSRGYNAERFERKMERLQAKMARWSGRTPSWGRGVSPTGNQAFDAYRAEALRRLEEEEVEFHQFLQRLRQARDKAEFDQFMAERGPRPAPTVDQTAA